MARPLRRRRRRSLLVLARVYALTLIVLVAIVVAGAYELLTAPQLRARDVVVKSTPHVSENEIRAAALIDPKSNVWLLNIHAIRRRIEGIPRVDHASVSRAFPARVSVVVTERKAWACVASKADRRAIDVTGRVLSVGCAANLPLIETRAAAPVPGSTVVEPQTHELIRDMRCVERTLSLRSVTFDRFGSLEGLTRQGTIVRFGTDTNLMAKLALVAPIQAATQSHGRRIRVIDLRAPGTPTVVY